MRHARPWLALAALSSALLAAVLVGRALLLQPRQAVGATASGLVAVDEGAAAQRLAAALRIPTVSGQEKPPDPAALASLHGHLAASFPRLHQALTREVVGGSLLYTWPGRDAAAAPIVLAAHLDTVPVERPESWAQPPFSGAQAEGYVWGRGALDDKGSVLAICEAVEALLASGFAPVRTVVLAFGHDEELGGQHGAAVMASMLKQRGARPLLTLDEGLAIVEGVVPGLARPVALVGVAEKGVLTIELTVAKEGGHSSMPAAESAVGILAGALERLEKSPMPARLEGVAHRMFAHLAPEMPFAPRLVFANLWLFGRVVRSELEGKPSAAALLRTTTALTIVEAGVKENVIPQRARAVVNFRVLPGDGAEAVLGHVTRTVGDDRVQVRTMYPPDDASSVAPDEGAAYDAIATAVRDVMPEVVVAPGLVVGQTDGRHYQQLGGPVYRFAPYRLAPVDLTRFHGTDERVAPEDHARAIRVYARLLQVAAAR